MKNQEYIKKYHLGIHDEVNGRNIDIAEVQQMFKLDLWYDYKANLQLASINKELSLVDYDRVYNQMIQKLDGLSKKTPYGIPDCFYEDTDTFYNNLLEEFCPKVYSFLEDVKTWNVDGYSDKFTEYFRTYNFNYYHHVNQIDFRKFPKVLQFVYEIYKEKKNYADRKEHERNEKEWRDYFNNRRSNFYEHLFSFLDSSHLIPTDSFDILSLTPNASIDDVKTAYRALVNIHHPDKGGNSDKFIQITEAKDKCLQYLK
jgi:hypothetical protein